MASRRSAPKRSVTEVAPKDEPKKVVDTAAALKSFQGAAYMHGFEPIFTDDDSSVWVCRLWHHVFVAVWSPYRNNYVLSSAVTTTGVDAVKHGRHTEEVNWYNAYFCDKDTMMLEDSIESIYTAAVACLEKFFGFDVMSQWRSFKPIREERVTLVLTHPLGAEIHIDAAFEEWDDPELGIDLGRVSTWVKPSMIDQVNSHHTWVLANGSMRKTSSDQSSGGVQHPRWLMLRALFDVMQARIE